MSTAKTAKTATVDLGLMQVEGLLGDDGEFYIGVSQIAELFQFPIKHASRDLKVLLGAGSQFPSDPFLKLKTDLHPKAINAMPIADFQRLLRKLDKKGYELADQLLDILSSVSLNEFFCDAFGQKADKGEIVAQLKARFESKPLFWQLTERIKRWITETDRDPANNHYYSSAFDALNVGLFGKTAKQIRSELGLTSSSQLIRDHFGAEALRRINVIQEFSGLLMDEGGYSPVEAVKQAISTYRYEPIDHQRQHI